MQKISWTQFMCVRICLSESGRIDPTQYVCITIHGTQWQRRSAICIWSGFDQVKGSISVRFEINIRIGHTQLWWILPWNYRAPRARFPHPFVTIYALSIHKMIGRVVGTIWNWSHGRNVSSLGFTAPLSPYSYRHIASYIKKASFINLV